MADLVRIAGPTFIERSRQWITWQHQKVLLAISRCRTPLSVDIAISVPAAGIPPSRTTRVLWGVFSNGE
jgi:hypothetical protein